MTEETTRLVPTRVDSNGIPYIEAMTSPVENKVRGLFVIPSSTVVPIVFVPGVMGSNLKAKRKISLGNGSSINAGSRVWNVDSLTSPMSWWGKGPDYRQAVMNKDVLTVDNGGLIGEGKRSQPLGPGTAPAAIQVPSGETELSRLPIKLVKDRGWGTVGWCYYGAFLDWLHFQINEGHVIDGQPNSVSSPCCNWWEPRLPGRKPMCHR